MDSLATRRLVRPPGPQRLHLLSERDGIGLASDSRHHPPQAVAQSAVVNAGQHTVQGRRNSA